MMVSGFFFQNIPKDQQDINIYILEYGLLQSPQGNNKNSNIHSTKVLQLCSFNCDITIKEINVTSIIPSFKFANFIFCPIHMIA